ncbi:MAG: hypothetical protein KJ025_00540 [Burkholderiales bacterium]|nr:hypothetical protein [Burkholderiales bacterium]
MKVVPSHHGWRWLARGWTLFTASPFMWLTMIFAYWLLVGFVGLVPVVGAAAAVVLIPVFSVSFMAMCRALERRRPLEPGLLFAGFRANLPALLTLGGIYLVASAAILAASATVDDGHLMRWMLAGTAVPQEAFADGSVLNAALLALALYLPVLAAFWFAPVLAAWDAMPAAKALFYSFFAVLANWRAFLVYGMVVAAVGTIVPGIAVAFVGAALQASPEVRTVVPAFVLMFFIGLMPTLFASFYASYRDVFPPAPPDAAPPEPASPAG